MLHQLCLSSMNTVLCHQRNLQHQNLRIRKSEFGKLDEFCDLFNLTNLVTSPTCFTKTHKSTVDLILTNEGNSFQKAKVTETGLSDFHKLVTTFLRSHFNRLKPIAIYYRNQKKFNQQKTLKIQTSVSIQTTQTRIMN